MVIGSDITPQILVQGLHHNVCGTLMAQNTIFGWILSGPIAEKISTFSTCVTESQNDSLNSLLRKCWEQEEVSTGKTLSEDDKRCEKLYRSTTIRQADGRYMVKLPFKEDFAEKIALGHSRLGAQLQYLSIERSLEKRPELKHKYAEVLDEYLAMDHMAPTSSREVINEGKYFSFY
ncbi:PREDICTED: uncharacterized protein LOC108363817 [Rhagoletis zephyria]|uniref:uncharacterized protein LOC108363817 n=1 Tax=Rhagoletis zephyria TaxID=28612 RepID=UPI000811903C|nr:PREDICTED: uncharacterized protein LOC108363817 [Rhagoletis zephyria]